MLHSYEILGINLSLTCPFAPPFPRFFFVSTWPCLGAGGLLSVPMRKKRPITSNTKYWNAHNYEKI